jgi:siroheme synthase-like protein
MYPLMLDGASLSAVVVGAGNVAFRKVRGLLDAGAHVRVVAPEVSSELRALAASNSSLEICVASYSPGHLDSALFIIAATDDPRLNDQIAADARAAGRLANNVSDPELGNCATPAIHRAGDVVVAVSTGRVPPAAKRIRDAIADRIDERFDVAVRELSMLRRTLLDAGRRDRWQEAAASLAGPSFCDDVETGRFESRLAEWR